MINLPHNIIVLTEDDSIVKTKHFMFYRHAPISDQFNISISQIAMSDMIIIVCKESSEFYVARNRFGQPQPQVLPLKDIGNCIPGMTPELLMEQMVTASL